MQAKIMLASQKITIGCYLVLVKVYIMYAVPLPTAMGLFSVMLLPSLPAMYNW